METKHNIEQMYKSRKVDKGCSEMLQYHRLAQAKTVETVPQNPTLTQPTSIAIPIQQAATTVTYTQPVTIPMTVPTQPVVTASGQPQQFQILCPMYFCRKTVPNNYLLPIYPNDQIQRKKRRTLISKIEKKKKRKKKKRMMIGMVPYKNKRRKKKENSKKENLK